MKRRCVLLSMMTVVVFGAAGTSRSFTAEASEPTTYGWRGNWTGRFPEATPPVRWGRTAKGVLAGLTYQAARPSNQLARGSRSIEDGLVCDWLVIGPFPAEDSVEDFDAALASLLRRSGHARRTPHPAGDDPQTVQPAAILAMHRR